MKAQFTQPVSSPSFKILFCLFVFILASGFSFTATAQSNTMDLTADDYAEILDLYFKYPLALDSGDGEAYADLFTEDGRFGENVVGREALIDFASRDPRPVRHAPLTPTIIPTAEGARGVVLNLFIDVSRSPAVITRVSQYTDTLVKTQEGWKFQSRTNGTADLREEAATTNQKLRN